MFIPLLPLQAHRSSSSKWSLCPYSLCSMFQLLQIKIECRWNARWIRAIEGGGGDTRAFPRTNLGPLTTNPISECGNYGWAMLRDDEQGEGDTDTHRHHCCSAKDRRGMQRFRTAEGDTIPFKMRRGSASLKCSFSIFVGWIGGGNHPRRWYSGHFGGSGGPIED